MSSAKSLTDRILREMKSAWPNVPMDADRVSLWNRVLTKFIRERGEENVLAAWEEIVLSAKYPIAPAEFVGYLPKTKPLSLTPEEMERERLAWESERKTPEYIRAERELKKKFQEFNQKFGIGKPKTEATQ